SGFLAADAVETCLDRPEQAAEALRQYETEVKASLERFTWFIYRITSPAIRTLFMAPRNYFRIEEAVLSLLAGDINAKSPIRPRLALFKALFYVKTGFARLIGALAPPATKTLPSRG